MSDEKLLPCRGCSKAEQREVLHPESRFGRQASRARGRKASCVAYYQSRESQRAAVTRPGASITPWGANLEDVT